MSEAEDVYERMIEHQFIEPAAGPADRQTYGITKKYGRGRLSRWRIGDGLEMAHIADTTYRGRIHADFANTPDEWEIVLVLGGRCQITAHPVGEQLSAREGDLLFFRNNPATEMFEMSASRFEGISLVLNVAQQDLPENMSALLQQHLPASMRNSHLIVTAAPRHIVWLFRSLLTPAERGGATSRFFRLKGMAWQIVAESLEWLEHQEQVPLTLDEQDRQLLHKARDMLLQRLDDPPSPEELSRVCCMNTNKLRKAFKMMFGVTVADFVLEEKAHMGKYWLECTAMSVGEIASALGYNNPSKFSSLFKKQYGASPRDWRSRSAGAGAGADVQAD